MVRLLPELQPLALLYTIFDRNVIPFRILVFKIWISHWQKTNFFSTFYTAINVSGGPFGAFYRPKMTVKDSTLSLLATRGACNPNVQGPVSSKDGKLSPPLVSPSFFFSSWIFLPRSTIWTPGTGYCCRCCCCCHSCRCCHCCRRCPCCSCCCYCHCCCPLSLLSLLSVLSLSSLLLL